MHECVKAIWALYIHKIFIGIVRRYILCRSSYHWLALFSLTQVIMFGANSPTYGCYFPIETCYKFVDRFLCSQNENIPLQHNLQPTPFWLIGTELSFTIEASPFSMAMESQALAY